MRKRGECGDEQRDEKFSTGKDGDSVSFLNRGRSWINRRDGDDEVTPLVSTEERETVGDCKFRIHGKWRTANAVQDGKRYTRRNV